MSHTQTTQSEFTRQAESFRESPTLSAAALTDRVGEALGPTRQRVLDLACGPGLLVPTLCARARSVVGLDLTPRNLSLARQAHPRPSLQLVRGLADALPFAKACFDGVVIRLALHHFLDPAAVLGGVRELLGRGGRVVVLDVLGAEDAGVAALRDAIERLRDPSHSALLSRSSMHRHLRASGLTLSQETLWSQPREFSEWARIINEPRRMADLEIVMRELLGRGADVGMQLREDAHQLWFTYDWGLFVGDVA